MTTNFRPMIALLAALALPACGDDGSNNNNPTPDAPGSDAPPDAEPPAVTYHQIEQLARPGINEALLITDAFLGGYNATAPSFTGVPSATLDQVVGEAKTVLKAIYLGSCLLNGVLGLDAASGVHPAGAECAAVGTAVFEADGETLTAAAAAGAQDYADRVFAQFIPDVMRIDTSVDSSYLTLCGSPLDSSQLLCGGRKLNDDVIDVTYAYLIAGANVTKGPPNDGVAGQVRALTTDGVVFDNVDDANNSLNFEEGDPTNTQQGHPAVSDTFPYGAAPL
jgi:hypothetical protein